MNDLIQRLDAYGEAMTVRAVRTQNADVKFELLQIARVFAEASDALGRFERENCEHCGRVVYQSVSKAGS